MGKDHKPGTFEREDYESDLEVSEKTGTRVNTSFGSNNHNVYVHNNEGTHEHFFYDPNTQKSGWHGANYPTKSNHPKSVDNDKMSQARAQYMQDNPKQDQQTNKTDMTQAANQYTQDNPVSNQQQTSSVQGTEEGETAVTASNLSSAAQSSSSVDGEEASNSTGSNSSEESHDSNDDAVDCDDDSSDTDDGEDDGDCE